MVTAMTTRQPTATPYGALLRERRVAKGLSLRDVANELNVSHVYLADVERGSRGPLKPEHEPALLCVLTNTTADELDRARALSRPLKITLGNTPPQYQDLTIAFARRIERQNLGDVKLRQLLALLNSEDGD